MRLVPDAYYPLEIDSLPKGWAVRWLGQVAESIQPGFACGAHNDQGRGVPHLRMFNITRNGNIDVTKLKHVEFPKAARIAAGEVLFTNTNSYDLVGKTAAFNLAGNWAFSNHMTRIRFPNGFVAEFFARQLHLLWMLGYFQHRCTRHVNQASFGTKALADSVPLIVVPLAEQRRIVEAIEAHFTQLDAAVAALERVRANLKRYRESVLNAAVETAVRAAQNGRGRVVPLRELGELNRGKSRHRPRDDPALYGGPYPFVQTGDVRSSGGAIRSFTQTYSEIGLAQSRLWPKGTLCITIAANIAETGILAFDACFPDSVVGFQSADPHLVKWVQIFLQNERRRLDAEAPATAQKNINIAILVGLDVPVVEGENLVAIVEDVERRLSVADALATEVDAGLKRCARMRQAILKKAFEGRLVPQDPRDEAAGVMLERMKTKQVAVPPVARRGRPRKTKEV